MVQVETGFLDRSVSLNGQSRPYQIYVPADYDPDLEWPVVLVLHGAAGSSGLPQTTRDLAEQIRLRRSEFSGIGVFPQVRPGRSWTEPDEQAVAIAAVEQTIEEFNVDTQRVSVIGFSMGAIGAYRMVARSPQRFSAMVAIAGRVEVNQKFEAVDRAAHPFVNAADPFAALADRLKLIPVRLYHGDRDEVIGVEQSRRLAEALKAVGADVTYVEYPGADHAGAPTKAFAEPDLVKWLLSQRRGTL
jgi:predicted peptidase